MFEFLAQNSLFIVLLVVLVVWAGVDGYLFRIEGKIKKLEQQSHK